MSEYWHSFPEVKPRLGIHVLVERTDFRHVVAFLSMRNGGCFVEAKSRRTFPLHEARYFTYLIERPAHQPTAPQETKP